jgi:hypothetical protein
MESKGSILVLEEEQEKQENWTISKESKKQSWDLGPGKDGRALMGEP